MFVLFTDFGVHGPYVGQMKAVLHVGAPGVPVVDLLHDAPVYAPRPAAYLLAAYAPEFPAGSVFVTVVDPGVGSARRAVVLEADGRTYVGPDNGLLAIVARRAETARAWAITWRPDRLSDSFHGRDLFAPVAAMRARGAPVPGDAIDPASLARTDWPDDLAEIIYADPYGNAISGLRADRIGRDAVLTIGGHAIRFARTFSEAAPGAAFWHANSNGLVEVAVNQGHAARQLGLEPGTGFQIG